MHLEDCSYLRGRGSHLTNNHVTNLNKSVKFAEKIDFSGFKNRPIQAVESYINV